MSDDHPVLRPRSFRRPYQLVWEFFKDHPVPCVVAYLSMFGLMFKLGQFGAVGVPYIALCTTGELITSGVEGVVVLFLLAVAMLAIGTASVILILPYALLIRGVPRAKHDKSEAIDDSKQTAPAPVQDGSWKETTAAWGITAMAASVTLALAYWGGYMYCNIAQSYWNEETIYGPGLIKVQASIGGSKQHETLYLVGSIRDCYVLWNDNTSSAIMLPTAQCTTLVFADAHGFFARWAIGLWRGVQSTPVAIPWSMLGAYLLGLVWVTCWRLTRRSSERAKPS